MYNEILKKFEDAVGTDELEYVQMDCIEELEQKGADISVVDDILKIMERHPLEEFGCPGSATHFIEKFSNQGYEEKLIESLKRVPTVHTIWLLHRCFNDEKDIRHDEYKKIALELLESVSVLDEVKEAIKFYPWE